MRPYFYHDIGDWTDIWLARSRYGRVVARVGLACALLAEFALVAVVVLLIIGAIIG